MPATAEIAAPSTESPLDLIARICRERSIDPREFAGRNSSSWLVRARRDVAHDLRARGMALKTIGAFIGRDHTTVMYLLGKGE